MVARSLARTGGRRWRHAHHTGCCSPRWLHSIPFITQMQARRTHNSQLTSCSVYRAAWPGRGRGARGLNELATDSLQLVEQLFGGHVASAWPDKMRQCKNPTRPSLHAGQHFPRQTTTIRHRPRASLPAALNDASSRKQANHLCLEMRVLELVQERNPLLLVQRATVRALRVRDENLARAKLDEHLLHELERRVHLHGDRSLEDIQSATCSTCNMSRARPRCVLSASSYLHPRREPVSATCRLPLTLNSPCPNTG